MALHYQKESCPKLNDLSSSKHLLVRKLELVASEVRKEKRERRTFHHT